MVVIILCPLSNAVGGQCVHVRVHVCVYVFVLVLVLVLVCVCVCVCVRVRFVEFEYSRVKPCWFAFYHGRGEKDQFVVKYTLQPHLTVTFMT